MTAVKSAVITNMQSAKQRSDTTVAF